MRRDAAITGKLRIDRTQFTRDMAAARSETKKFANEMKNVHAGGGGGLKRNFTELNSRASAARNVLEQIEGAVNKPALANAWYNDLIDGLTAVMKNADAARAHMGKLRLISDEQSMTDKDLETMVEMSQRIQTMGHSAEFAADFLRELGNTAESMGKGLGDMSEMVEALDLIDQRGEAGLRQIIALTKSVPGLRAVLEQGFGTAVAADLEKMNISSKELSAGLLRGMKALDTARPGDGEIYLAQTDRKLQILGADAADNNGDLPERHPASAAAGTARLKEAVAERKKTEEKEKQTKLEFKRLTAFEREAAIAQEEIELDRARADNRRDDVDAAEIRLAILRESLQLAQEYSITEEQAAAHIREQTESRLQAAREIEDMESKKRRGEITGDLKIESLRALGKNKEADALQRQRDKAGLTAEGFTGAEADTILDQRATNEKRSNGGPKIRGANYSQPVGSALDAWEKHNLMRDDSPLNDHRQGRTKSNRPRSLAGEERGKVANELSRLRNLPGGSGNSEVVTAIRELKTKLEAIDTSIKEQNTVKDKIR